jgi:hypothetical protein
MLQLERDQAYYLGVSRACWAHAKNLSWSEAASKVLELYNELVVR